MKKKPKFRNEQREKEQITKKRFSFQPFRFMSSGADGKKEITREKKKLSDPSDSCPLISIG